IAGVLVAVLLIAACLSIVIGNRNTKKVTADFQRVTGLYTGSSVRLLGIKIGKITKIEPMGQFVRVSMTYDGKYRLPADAQAAIIPPSLIADRYVQFTPVYRGGPILRDKARIPVSRTMVPVELSTVLKSVNDLSVALGPNGANSDGALSRLVTVSANNLRGNGEQIHSTVTDLSKLLTTLADNKGDLVGTINNLDQFTHALRNSDGAVRSLTRDLATVSSQLSGDRQNLSEAISTLGVALGDVTQLVRDNRGTLVADVKGLTDVTGTLLKQKQALAEILDDAPTALQNLDGAYDPEAQALRTKNNILMGANPTLYLCQILKSLLNPDANSGLSAPGVSRTAYGTVCDPSGQLLPGTDIGKVIGQLTDGLVPTVNK
ncbi:MAG TPA: MCE family protein, partial [Frankiaceae bacterium]|nr:MCE family protein [Frankiaceae bacterium]